MTYRGTVKNGVVVLEGSPALQEGTLVRVEPLETSRPQVGSAEAIMRAVNEGARWNSSQDEADKLLAELKEMKQAELKSQSEVHSDDLLDDR